MVFGAVGTDRHNQCAHWFRDDKPLKNSCHCEEGVSPTWQSANPPFNKMRKELWKKLPEIVTSGAQIACTNEQVFGILMNERIFPTTGEKERTVLP